MRRGLLQRAAFGRGQIISALEKVAGIFAVRLETLCKKCRLQLAMLLLGRLRMLGNGMRYHLMRKFTITQGCCRQL